MDYRKVCNEVCAIARKVGLFLKEERHHLDVSQIEEKSAHNYVTEVDKASENMIVEALLELYSDADVLAEEGSGDFLGKDYCWVIDPLDGTTNYIQNISPYCVSIALKHKKETVIGVVYEVCRDECFYAWKGGEAYLNEEKITVSSIDQLSNATVLLGYPYAVENYKGLLVKLIQDLYGNVKVCRMLGASAVELCYIASGRADLRIENSLKPWDVAAGIFILESAGGKATDFFGERGDRSATGEELFASNGFLHNQLLPIE